MALAILQEAVCNCINQLSLNQSHFALIRVLYFKIKPVLGIRIPRYGPLQ